MFMMIQENQPQQQQQQNVQETQQQQQNLKTTNLQRTSSFNANNLTSAFNLFKQKQNTTLNLAQMFNHFNNNNNNVVITSQKLTNNKVRNDDDNIENRDTSELNDNLDDYEMMNEENEDNDNSFFHEAKLYNKLFFNHQTQTAQTTTGSASQLPVLKCKYFESPINQSQIQYDCSAPIARNTPENNEVRLIDYRQSKLASFAVDGKELICLPQAFEMFLKTLVGGLHTVYTKLKRLDIVPIVCNVEQVRVLRGLGAIQPGVNRCKLIAPSEFDILYDDCTNSGSRPGRPPKRHNTNPNENENENKNNNTTSSANNNESPKNSKLLLDLQANKTNTSSSSLSPYSIPTSSSASSTSSSSSSSSCSVNSVKNPTNSESNLNASFIRPNTSATPILTSPFQKNFSNKTQFDENPLNYQQSNLLQKLSLPYAQLTYGIKHSPSNSQPMSAKLVNNHEEMNYQENAANSSFNAAAAAAAAIAFYGRILQPNLQDTAQPSQPPIQPQQQFNYFQHLSQNPHLHPNHFAHFNLNEQHLHHLNSQQQNSKLNNDLSLTNDLALFHAKFAPPSTMQTLSNNYNLPHEQFNFTNFVASKNSNKTCDCVIQKGSANAQHSCGMKRKSFLKNSVENVTGNKSFYNQTSNMLSNNKNTKSPPLPLQEEVEVDVEEENEDRKISETYPKKKELHPLSVENLTGSRSCDNERVKVDDDEDEINCTNENNNEESFLSSQQLLNDKQEQMNDKIEANSLSLERNSLVNICSLIEAVKNGICRLEQDLQINIVNLNTNLMKEKTLRIQSQIRIAHLIRLQNKLRQKIKLQRRALNNQNQFKLKNKTKISCSEIKEKTLVEVSDEINETVDESEEAEQ